MAGLRGDLSSISRLKKALATLPTSLANDIANAAAPAMTGETQTAYDAGRSVYGETRPPTVDGRRMTLVRTGAVREQARFRSYGRFIWCTIGPKYARYLIGKYGILPNGPLPAGWSLRLKAEADAVVARTLQARIRA